ncbi:MAG: thiamine pyrophosphate-binding protein [Deltaproteobacteria bacterium]|nr:thiamine pyrophosphate-binding protein [Deltaproteobacteria bacterium]
MGGKPGRVAVIEQLLADGFTHMFGNPGTVEQGFLDVLSDYPSMKYFLTLQESVAVLVADGYARAARRPALVQLHSSPGLGNGIGALYQAKRGHSPLVVIAGDAGVRYGAMDAQMAADLVGMAQPVTKWATMVQHPSSLLRVLRRAYKVAVTPPMGPVYVCLPQDMLDEPNNEEVRPTSKVSTRVAPDEDTIETIARALVGAKRPVILAGNGVAYAGAESELQQIAESVGAEVYEVDNGEWLMPSDHPLFTGSTGHMFGSYSKPILSRADVVLVVGTYVVPEVFPELGDVFARDARVFHIDLDSWEIAKNHPVELGMVADPKLSLEKLVSALGKAHSSGSKDAAKRRYGEAAEMKSRALAQQLEKDAQSAGNTPMQFHTFAKELAARLPTDAILFDEALTNSPPIQRYRPTRERGQYFLTRGGSLGVGIPGAIGAKVARPDKTVVGFSGDGGSMYTIQALWSAVRHDVDAKFVVCNNRSYRLLQANIQQWWKEQSVTPHGYPLPFDLSWPPLRFDEMAKSMGVPSVRVERPEAIPAAVAQMLDHKGPFLCDVVVEGDVRPDLIGVHCGQ